MCVHLHVVAEMHALRTNVVTVGSYVYMYRYDIPLSDLNSFHQASTFRTLPISLYFSRTDLVMVVYKCRCVELGTRLGDGCVRCRCMELVMVYCTCQSSD